MSVTLHLRITVNLEEMEQISSAIQMPAEETCAICYAPLSDRVMVRLRRASLRECARCGSWMYSPRASAAQQAALHDNAEYFDHPYFALRRTVTPAQRRRCREVFQRLAGAVDLQRLGSDRVLDIGCDTGTFLVAARDEFGVAPVGLDVSARAIAVAREHGIEAYAVPIERVPESLGQFNIVTAIDLIEH